MDIDLISSKFRQPTNSRVSYNSEFHKGQLGSERQSRKKFQKIYQLMQSTIEDEYFDKANNALFDIEYPLNDDNINFLEENPCYHS